LDNIWKWLGFSQKDSAKRILEKNFIVNIDYIFLVHKQVEQKKGSGGHNKEIIKLNINTFKRYCLKAGTKKADEIHNYFIKLEHVLQEIILEESNEVRLQLEQTKLQLEDQKKNIEIEKQELLEKTLLEQFPINTQCIYYGKIDNKTLGKAPRLHNEDLIKFGQSNNLLDRIKSHKKNFTNFRLLAAFKVKNKIEIENAIKKHPILKERIRSITVEKPNYEEENYRELISYDNNEFTIEKINGYILEIIKENEYNIENYNLLLKKNEEMQEEIYKLKNQNEELIKLVETGNNKINKYENDVSDNAKTKIASNFALCKYGYFIYAYQFEEMRFVCSIVRQKDYDNVIKNLTDLHPSGNIICQIKCSYPLTERNMTFLLKQNAISLGQNKYECSTEMIKKILESSVKLEELLSEHGKDMDVLLDILSNKPTINCFDVNPEVPIVRKAKRSIDKIDKETGKVLATFESIEAAGRSCGLTTGTAIGYAVRENRQCKGFLWRYSGVSKEEQFAEQPVVKICCKNGEKNCFKNIAEAAKDANISAPALRRRILTDVHVNNYHWIFDKNATHYS
jgi:hypothetical protein